MSTDKQRLDFWNNSFLEIGYSAKMGGEGAGWYWQLGTNRRSGIKNVRDTLDSAMAQLKKPKQVAQDVAQTPAMRHNPAPRTTEEEWEEWPKEWVVRADLARELETELTEARREIEEHGSEVAALKRPLLRLTSLWHQLFFLLDITEESDSGNEFRPNYISSCRAVDGDRIQKILEEAKQLINAGVNN